MQPARLVDLTGAEEDCGAPALDRVRAVWAEVGPGEVLEVTTGIADQAFAVSAWTRRAGGRVLEESRRGGRITIRLTPGPA